MSAPSLKVTRGVPQGTLSGTILYTTDFKNDFLSKVEHSQKVQNFGKNIMHGGL